MIEINKQTEAGEMVAEALKTFMVAAKVRLSVVTGLSPSMLSHPHDHYGSFKDYYPMECSARAIAHKLSHYACQGFIPWGFDKPGELEARFDDYVGLVRRSVDWAFQHVLGLFTTHHRQLAAHLALAIIYVEEGLYQWALNL